MKKRNEIESIKAKLNLLTLYNTVIPHLLHNNKFISLKHG